MDASENKNITKNNERKLALSKQIDGISWALFFIMIGGIGLVPDEKVPGGAWLIGVGLIMLGNNLFRYMKEIKVVGFTIVLGILALLAGLGDLYVSAIGGRNSQMGKHLGQGTLYKEAKEKFMKDIKNLKLLPADNYPRATEHVEEMIEMIHTVQERDGDRGRDGDMEIGIGIGIGIRRVVEDGYRYWL